MSLKDTISNNIIDYLIEQILKDDKTYEELGYWDKTSLCKLIVKKNKEKISNRAIC